MVRLEEVQDEEFLQSKEFDDDDDYTDTDSSISGDEAEDDLPFEETLTDRVLALKDMVSPTTRRKISDICNTVSSYTRSGLWLGAKGVYALSVTTLFIGVPFSLLVADDMMLAEQEKEMRMREMGNEILTPGASSNQQGREQGKPQAAL
ncbi:MAG: hypothetical protein LQ340_001352 [Diploschistes diacapsis]|nr:MAG: hypothetical protein LQ340_001352 [Diploschistes diacapsis]